MKILPTQYSALVLERKDKFYKWLAVANKKAPRDENFYPGDHGVYLIENVITASELKEFLQSEYLGLFESELAEWHPSELWPADLTIELFMEFFYPNVHRQVYRTQKTTG